MFDEIFGKRPTDVQPPTKPAEVAEGPKEVQVAGLSDQLTAIYKALQRKPDQMEQVTIGGLQNPQYHFDNREYRNVYFFADASVAGVGLSCSFANQNWSYPVQAGMNVLNMPQGTLITSGTQISITVVWSDVDKLQAPDEVALTGSNTNDITLQNAATATGDGTVHTITTGKETITLVASGTATSFTVQFQVQGSDGNWYLTNGTNVGGNGGSGVVGTVGTNAQASSVTGFGQVFQVDLSGWKAFKAALTAVSGGNVTVAGRLTFA